MFIEVTVLKKYAGDDYFTEKRKLFNFDKVESVNPCDEFLELQLSDGVVKIKEDYEAIKRKLKS